MHLDRLEYRRSALRVAGRRRLPAGRCQRGASDIHWQPGGDGFDVRFRLDGVLQTVATLPKHIGPNVVGRLKVLADLLTYRTDCPQEGRLRTAADAAEQSQGQDNDAVEMRVSTFPTLYGERAVVRLFGAARSLQRLDDLGLTPDVLAPLRQLLAETSGAILVSGPAGSGKTTTVYACLRELAAVHGGARSLMSIEDPIEVAVSGVAQSQVHAPAGFDLATGLRFLMRQDPEVILVGEIRDRATAEAALQASLTGHLLLSTFHAGSAAETVGRLLDMGIEPYVLRSGLLAILNQRLLRRLCSCAEAIDDPCCAAGPRGRRPRAVRRAAPRAAARAIAAVFSSRRCSAGPRATWAARSSPAPAPRGSNGSPRAAAWSPAGSARSRRSRPA